MSINLTVKNEVFLNVRLVNRGVVLQISRLYSPVVFDK